MTNKDLDNFYQELVQESQKVTTYQKIKDSVLDFAGYYRDFDAINESQEEIKRKDNWNFFLISSTGISLMIFSGIGLHYLGRGIDYMLS